ncbi:MAG: oligosaccharide flippase family protein [Gemmatimonadetes bacterium]|nr:oligosaccharide flippase family protein [Gemmatimonadota bacterium]
MSPTFARGLYWVSASMILGRSARILSLFILAGLLPAEDFGRYAALWVVVDGLLLLQGFGIGHSLVIDRSNNDESTDSVFAISVTLGLALSLIGIAGAGLIESITGMQGIAAAFRVACLVVLLQGLLLVPARLFDRELDFQKRFLPAITSSTGYLIVAVSLAYRGFGLWALVIGEVASFALEAATYWLLTPRKPRFRVRMDFVRQHLTFGWAVFGGTVLIYLIRSIDKFAISRGPGAAELGVFAFALSIALLPASVLTRMINGVLFPHYAASETQEARNELFLSATRVMVGLGICFAVVLILFGGFLLETFYGNKWEAAVVPLAILAILGLFRTLTALLSDLYVGSGRPGLFRAMTMIQLVVAAVGLLLLPVPGAVPVAVVMAVAGGVAVMAGFLIARARIRFAVRPFFACLRAPVIAAAVPIALWAAARAMPQYTGIAAPALALLLGTCGYLACWIALDRETRALLQGALRGFAGAERRPS